MSQTVMPPAGNVVPMPRSMPMSAPMPPNCFSQLYGLNQCYDDIKAMQAILVKVICDLASTNADFQQCLAAGIAASGSNVPLLGVTNGADAQPGQVGEVFHNLVAVTYPGPTASSQVVSMGVLPAGDWDVEAVFSTGNFTGGIQFLTGTLAVPIVLPGFSNRMYGVNISIGSASDPNSWGGQVFSQPTRALTTAPTLIPITLYTNVTGDAAANSTNGTMELFARRRR